MIGMDAEVEYSVRSFLRETKVLLFERSTFCSTPGVGWWQAMRTVDIVRMAYAGASKLRQCFASHHSLWASARRTDVGRVES